MFNKEKNTIFVYCPDINVYNSTVDLMYDYANIIKEQLKYNVVILHSKDTFGHINWKNKPECEIRYLTSDIRFDEQDILLFPADNVALLFTIKDLKVRKIPVVVEAYNFIAASLFTTKHSAALHIKDLGVEKVLVLDNDSVLGKDNIDTLLKGFFKVSDEDIIHQPFQYINTDLYNDVMETTTEPTVKPLEDGTFTVEDVVETKKKDIDVLIKVGHAVTNSLVGYLVNNNTHGWTIDFVDYTMSESVRANKMKSSKVYIDVDHHSIETARARHCKNYVMGHVIDTINEVGVECFIDMIKKLIESGEDKHFKNLNKNAKKVNLSQTKEMIKYDACKQEKAE